MRRKIVERKAMDESNGDHFNIQKIRLHRGIIKELERMKRDDS